MPSSDSQLFGYSLVHALENFEAFRELPIPEQHVYLETAKKFEAYYQSHFKSPEELEEELGGSIKTWRKFLTMKPVRDYIKRKTDEDIEIYNRQAIAKQAQKAAEAGDSKAAAYLHKLAEDQTTQVNKAKVILHYIPRPDRESNVTP